MPQFAFQATDRLGNSVEGKVTAANPAFAANEIGKMGYALVSLQPVSESPVTESMPAMMPAPDNTTLAMPPPAPMNGRPAPINLSQAFDETVSGGGAVALAEGGGGWNAPESSNQEERLEPWQRGGPVAQAPAPTVSLNASGVPIAKTQAMSALPGLEGGPRPESAPVREGAGRPAYSPAFSQNKSFWQRFKETMIYPIVSGVVIKDLAPYYRQFATLINAGLPLFQTLVALESNTQNAKLKEITRAAQSRVQAGGRFSEVMAAYPWVFSPMQIEMVRASEEGGLLDQVLRQIADYVEHELEVRRLISRETIYPKIVMFVALMLLGVSGFTGGQMAIVGLVLQGDVKTYFMNTIGAALILLIPIFAAVVAFRLFLFNIPGVRDGYDSFKIMIPAIGKLVKMFALAKFCRTFAALNRAGFGMPNALYIAGDASGNAVIRNAAYRGALRAERGESVADALAASGHFPPLTLDMFRTGEMAGNMDDMLDKMADFYEAEGKMKTHQAALIFGVVVFLIVAFLVGSAIIGLYGGYAHNSTTLPSEN